MEIASDTIGLFLQIIGILIVLLSQISFGIRAWRKFGSLRKVFFAMAGTVRIGSGGTAEEFKKRREEELKETFPELWNLASYLREDIWVTAIGLIVTLIGLLFEISHLTLTLPV